MTIANIIEQEVLDFTFVVENVKKAAILYKLYLLSQVTRKRQHQEIALVSNCGSRTLVTIIGCLVYVRIIYD